MNGLQPSFGVKLRINLHLFMAALSGLIAWAIWPDSLEWWGLGLIAIILWANSFGLLIKAVSDIIALYSRDETLAALAAQAKESKADNLADTDLLKAKGMIDG
ncbi:MAG: hypothetical protein AAF903_09170 [Pseudomonadota bacterium]